ncbi:MAG: flavin reductase (DIM6/NTAB) family NADH-FMN oxidoreductase RutF [Alphaproteobacteria bacterium]|jgi:flavin reductase (DIM6/NTAB) family NADH-FMN oxidoreductase RutF
MPEIEKINPERETWDRLFANVGQLAIITTVDAQDNVNAATFATCVRVVHDPVHIAFTTSLYKDTYKNIQETKQFTINLPSFDREILEKACILGLPFERGVNELEKAGFTSLPATVIKPPRIVECHRHFECEVEWMKEWGDRVTIVGNCVAASVDSDCVDDRGYILWDRVKPVQYCGAPYQKYSGPPYGHMFVAAYETMTVGTPYDGPEMEKHDQMVEDELHFR